MATEHPQFWRYVRALAAPVLLWTLFATLLIRPLQTWLQGDRNYDEAAMQEWIAAAKAEPDELEELDVEF